MNVILFDHVTLLDFIIRISSYGGVIILAICYSVKTFIDNRKNKKKEKQ